ncbi:7-carboxy-7-deazaguanine synthase QueE [Apibacter sp.]|uniref:7-carboxy-7-deazaguanine synthase QueE n=1 Tax=Apibacter sp. TaxID=2023709 RepID=UPI0025D64FBA|nr:7-carboxy-7-deazaguanine synthase QueE [Apibacter sp.]MCT6868964.1 7-carboxy-7-deazaguanine synthase QueE [Apibacter sp.]
MKEFMNEELKSGLSLPIMEHFYTIQGEGRHTGTAAYFIRIGGCDVGCHWCDVKESWNPSIHPVSSVEEIAKMAASKSKTIVLTGGEPLMWNLEPLTAILKNLGCTIHIETSGAYNLSGHIDWICLSPKKTSLPLEGVYAKANELKVIIYNNHDFIFAEEQASKTNNNAILYLQPEWSNRDKMTTKIIDYVMRNPKWHISLQTHKYLNIP